VRKYNGVGTPEAVFDNVHCWHCNGLMRGEFSPIICLIPFWNWKQKSDTSSMVLFHRIMNYVQFITMIVSWYVQISSFQNITQLKMKALSFVLNG
jgi:hypothetical protein